ncbi:MAG: prolipoprotein diacylglyceryl transferase [Desulfarculaceae bacterium]|nr:prolipoprotein diacylglyceryl transferase [Desulfarculaceae bacterium]
MENAILILLLGAGLASLLWWGCRHLPGERWQILAAVPLAKQGDGSWSGMNITYYGLITAGGVMLSSALLLFMLGSVGVPALGALVFGLPLISVSAPAARIMARVVEHKRFTLTVAGAFFVGLLAAPWLALGARAALGNSMGFEFPVLPALTAMAVAYVFGEGLGRMACLSFGCCYGKPLDSLSPRMRSLLEPLAMSFSGATKKISYESGLAGRKVVPVQALSAALNMATGLAGLSLFLSGRYALALLLSVGVSQVWRVLAEMLRADHRGGGKLTAYQWMALAALPYCALVLWALPAATDPLPSLGAGLAVLWNPWVLLGLQALGIAALLYTGRSRVTGATVKFHVVQENI